MSFKTKTPAKYGVAATMAANSSCEDVRNISSRRRNLLHLIHRYLVEHGYFGAAEALKGESKLAEEYELCDNIDLDSIYLDYLSFFNMRFGKYPRILKKNAPRLRVEVATGSARSSNGIGPTTDAATGSCTPEPQLLITKLETATSADQELPPFGDIEHGPVRDESLFASQDWQGLAELVKATILRESSKLHWSDVCGNQRAIELMYEAVITPIEFPELFTLGLQPWRSLLLHGPPGSGKTYLAKTLYAETQGQVTFFNVSASIMVSKWRGESEKILRMLFHMAEQRAPSIVFFDEIESLTSRRDRPTDHESSKRFKNELLQLLDGMEHTLNGVFVLASTNLPWEIDDAFLRRFEKKLLVQLPNAAERGNLISRILTASVPLTTPLLQRLVELSENFTGDELRLVCKEISMESVRSATQAKAQGDAMPSITPAALEHSVEQAFKQVRPLGHKLLARHEQWQKENGS